MSNSTQASDQNSSLDRDRISVRGRLQRLTVAWLRACFPGEVVRNKPERGARLIEEAAELSQVLGTPRELAHRLVDRAYDNPPGDAVQEVGGLAIVLSSAAAMLDLDVDECHQMELERLIGAIDATRERHARKVEQGYVA